MRVVNVVTSTYFNHTNGIDNELDYYWGTSATACTASGTFIEIPPTLPTGYVDGTQWDDASVGDFSMSTGSNTTESGVASTAIGGFTTASGVYSTALGVRTTASGDFSTAIGTLASTNGHAGAFVYGDSSTIGSLALVIPSSANQFVVRAAGGTTFYSNSALTTGVSFAANRTSWATVSDRNRKEDFRDINGEEILNKLAALPVTSWRYKNDDSGNRYIGPMAQDFHALFGLGTDTTIATLDMDGVTLAGIKALERRTADLQVENTTLRDQLERLMRRVEQLEAKHSATQ